MCAVTKTRLTTNRRKRNEHSEKNEELYESELEINARKVYVSIHKNWASEWILFRNKTKNIFRATTLNHRRGKYKIYTCMYANELAEKNYYYGILRSNCL